MNWNADGWESLKWMTGQYKGGGKNRTGNGKRRAKVWIARFGESETGCCCYCKKELTFQESTLEHITPLNKGGNNDMCNLDIACNYCNNKKNTCEQRGEPWQL